MKNKFIITFDPVTSRYVLSERKRFLWFTYLKFIASDENYKIIAASSELLNHLSR